ncbi:MAG TPA: type II toxin-antitoxin system VapB family antitoxin [Thermoanaerobaculia bacterium]|nr:type II toxin-antitoxin system VapB family antitoxin [Thermoanaerobaculia bacterium]
MRTTVEINDQLLREAKRRAALEGRPLRALIEDALRAMIQAPAAGTPGFRLSWRTESGRIQPGVRLDDRESLFDVMEGR